MLKRFTLQRLFLMFFDTVISKTTACAVFARTTD